MATASSTESGGNNSDSGADEKPQIQPLRLPTAEEIRGQDIWNNCAVRSFVSGVMGGGLGLATGLFLGALDNPIMQEEMTGKQQFIYTAKQMGRRSWGSAKAFAVMGFIFSAAECVIEKARAKFDTANTVFAGCVTGGAILAKRILYASMKMTYNVILASAVCLTCPHLFVFCPCRWSKSGMCRVCWLCSIQLS